MTSSQTRLLSLVTKLRACSSQDNKFSKELARDAWEHFIGAWRPGDELTPAVIAAFVIHDSSFAPLLDQTEHAQMRALCRLALDRFEEKSNPPNKLGKTLAAILEIPT